MTAATRQVAAATPPGRSDQAMAASTSSSVGKRPSWRLEKRSAPSTVISKTPLAPRRNATFACGCFERIVSRAALARGS